jgi:hypothetical protein
MVGLRRWRRESLLANLAACLRSFQQCTNLLEEKALGRMQGRTRGRPGLPPPHRPSISPSRCLQLLPSPPVMSYLLPVDLLPLILSPVLSVCRATLTSTPSCGSVRAHSNQCARAHTQICMACGGAHCKATHRSPTIYPFSHTCSPSQSLSLIYIETHIY